MNKQLLYATLTGLLLPATSMFGMNDSGFTLRRNQRRIEAHTIKSAAALFDEQKAVPVQLKNGDEQRYSDKRGSFNKALNHQDNGFPNTTAFASMVNALNSGNPSAFNAIQLGGSRRLVNPQASLAYSLSANDTWINAISAAPRFDSAETAGEMVEDYWTVLLRDVPFNEFDTDGTAIAAAADLSTLSDFRGPKVNGVVTAGTLLRGPTPGDLAGPFISQFLYLPVAYGAVTVAGGAGIDQTILPPTTVDFMSNFADWFTVIDGGDTGDTIMYGATPTFIRTPRDLTEYVHKDFPCTAGISAAIILNSFGAEAISSTNPYFSNSTQEAFVMFGMGELITLVEEAVNEALKAAWYQKWQVNRRLRPEEFGFYLQEQLVNGTALGIHSDLLNSAVLAMIFGTYGTYFLPQAYPEGSPTHPSYPAGHATFIGAAVTILKAWFNEDFIIPAPVEPNPANDALIAYTGDPLTVGGELNKLASNISLGRDFAGVHYRSDGWQGMLLGEKVAIDVLNNRSYLFNENFSGYVFTSFEGNRVVAGQKRTP